MELIVNESPAADRVHRCAYRDQPDGPLCGQPAQMHLLVKPHGDDTPYFLAACLPHYPAAVAVARMVDAHEFRGWCGIAGARWEPRLNECVLDGSGADPLAGTQTVALEPVS